MTITLIILLLLMLGAPPGRFANGFGGAGHFTPYSGERHSHHSPEVLDHVRAT